MHKVVDNILILKRVDYGEADRIVTVLSQHGGKFSLLARGVRKPKSKLAGGIEPFCVNNVTYLQTPRELKTLVSATAQQQLDTITKNIDLLDTGYLILRAINAFTEHECEDQYYTITADSLIKLNNGTDRHVVYVWFMAQLLRLSGHGINTQTAANSQPLAADDTFRFATQDMAFTPDTAGLYNAGHIKLLRIAATLHLKNYASVQNIQQYAADLTPLLAEIASIITQKNLK